MGRPYTIPYFFESTQRRMMKEPCGNDTISFKSWKGNFYQFYLGEFHQHPALILTSTLRDSYYLPAACLSLEMSVERFRKASENITPIKGSFSGYYRYGLKLVEQHDTLISHLEADGMYFSEEVLKEVYSELKRRTKDE